MLYRTDRLEPLAEALGVLGFARAQAARQARHLTHPGLCLDAIQFGIEHGGRAGLLKVRSRRNAAGAIGTAVLRSSAPSRAAPLA